MTLTNTSAQRLRSYITCIERLDAEAKAITDDRKEVFKEAKGFGFDAKIMRIVISVRKMDAIDYDEQCALVEVYLAAMKLPDEVREAAKEALRPGVDDDEPPPDGPTSDDPVLKAEFPEPLPPPASITPERQPPVTWFVPAPAQPDLPAGDQA